MRKRRKRKPAKRTGLGSIGGKLGAATPKKRTKRPRMGDMKRVTIGPGGVKPPLAASTPKPKPKPRGSTPTKKKKKKKPAAW